MPLQQKNSQYVASYYAASYYAASINNNASYPQLKNEIETEVCIIGAGFTGLSTALHLAEKGVKVCVLEAEKVAWGASGRNGGHVGTGQRVSQQVLEKQFGFVMAKKLWGFSLQAVELVEDLIKKYQIQCDLKHGILHVAAKHNDIEEMKISCDNLNRNYAYDKFSFIEKDEVDAMLGTDKFYGGQLDEGALHLHPLNYALGLAVAATRAGVQCFEQSKVTYYEEAEHITIHTEHGIVRAKQMVLACNGYLEKLEQKIARKLCPLIILY